jgi:multiple sugar transport system substrate-binding protein
VTITHASGRLRVPALVAATLATTLILSSCGRDTGTESPVASTSVDDKPATGTVTLWAPDGDATALDKVLAGYRTANPDLDLKVTLVPSDDYNTKLQTAISSGTAPDISFVYTEAQTQFLASKAFAAVPEGLVDSASFFSGAWDSGTYQSTTYSVPWYVYTRVLIYRKDFAAKGKATLPTTWEETIPFYQALEAGGATKGLGADVGWDTYTGQNVAVDAYQAGATLLDSAGTKWDFDSPAAVSAIEFAARPFTSGVSAIDTPQFLDAQPYFVKGKTGSMISGPWVIASLDQTAKEDGWTAEHVGTAVLPKGSAGGVGPLAGGSWAVSAASKNAASAWKVVRQMAQQDTQIAQFTNYGSMPAVQAAWQDQAIAGNTLYDAFFEQLKDVKPMPSVPTWNQVSTAIGKELEAVARGTETAEQAAKNLQSQADSIGVGQ